MRILFLGGTRFIGHHAAARAVAAGHDVWVAHRGNHPCEVAGVVRMRVDRTLPSDVSDAVEAARPDAVVDTRAMTAEDAAAIQPGQATPPASRPEGVNASQYQRSVGASSRSSSAVSRPPPTAIAAASLKKRKQ